MVNCLWLPKQKTKNLEAIISEWGSPKIDFAMVPIPIWNLLRK